MTQDVSKEQLEEMYVKFVEILNDFMAKKQISEAVHLLNWFCQVYIPMGAGPSMANQWTLDVTKPIRDGTVVLLCHTNKPIRCIAALEMNVKSTKCVPEQFRYSFHKYFMKKQKKPVPGSRKKTIEVNNLVIPNKKPQAIITQKRGGWVIWKPSLEMNINIHDKNFSTFDEKLKYWYNKMVRGMEQPPPNTFFRSRAHYGFEQFLLNDYPTKEWTQCTLNYRKKNKTSKSVDERGMKNRGLIGYTPLSEKHNAERLLKKTSIAVESSNRSVKRLKGTYDDEQQEVYIKRTEADDDGEEIVIPPLDFETYLKPPPPPPSLPSSIQQQQPSNQWMTSDDYTSLHDFLDNLL